MISRIVERQLASLEVAKAAPKDPEGLEYLFPRFRALSLEVGASYKITVSDAARRNEALAANWNGGHAIPKEFDAKVDKKVGNMVCLNDGRSLWWVPESEIEEAKL